MRKLVSLVFVFSIAMLFVLAVPRAFAKTGGSVAVDSTSECDGHYQDRSICDSGVIWINQSSAQLENCLLSCTLSCNGSSDTTCTMVDFDVDDPANTCDSKSGNKLAQYAAYDFTYTTTPAGADTVCSITVIALDCTDPSLEGVVAGDGFHSCEE